jgi:cyclopropane-fatty-acyl-phospholipid synthase
MSKMIDNTQNKFRLKLEKLLEGTDIVFNGNNPWDISVYNPKLYEKILTQGSLGLGGILSNLMNYLINSVLRKLEAE